MIKHNKKAVVKLLRKYIKLTYGTQTEAAKAWGYKHRNSVHRMLKDPDLIPDKILRKLKLKRVEETYYCEINTRIKR